MNNVKAQSIRHLHLHLAVTFKQDEVKTHCKLRRRTALQEILYGFISNGCIGVMDFSVGKRRSSCPKRHALEAEYLTPIQVSRQELDV